MTLQAPRSWLRPSAQLVVDAVYTRPDRSPGLKIPIVPTSKADSPGAVLKMLASLMKLGGDITPFTPIWTRSISPLATEADAAANG